LHFRQYTSISFWGLGHSLRKPSQPTLLAGGHSWLVDSSLERERDEVCCTYISRVLFPYINRTLICKKSGQKTLRDLSL
jgi:hypothetical protein